MRQRGQLRRALASVVGVMMLSTFLASPDARAATPGTHGATTGFSFPGQFAGQSSTAIGADLDAVVASGAAWIRMDVAWSVVEGTRGTYRWSVYDGAMNAAKSRGLNVLVVLAYAPSWATGCAGTDKCLPTSTNISAWGAFAGAAAQHFAGKANAYELWNEENQSWAAGTPDPVRYVAMARAAYPVIKAADPAVTVLVGGAGPSATGNGEYSPLDWTKAVWAAGIDGSFDAWAAHPYCFPALPEAINTRTWSGWWAMVDIHSFLVSQGRDVKVWMTEFGTPTRDKGYADTFQRDSILKAIDLAASYPWSGPLFLYTLRDNSASTTDYGESFGLLNTDRTPKTAWQPVSDKLHAARPGASVPAAVAPASPVDEGGTRLDVVRRTADGSLRTNTWNGFSWTGWARMDGIALYEPETVSSPNGDIDVFAVGTDRALWRRRWTASSGWSPWKRLGGTLTSAPGAVLSGADRFDVFARGGDDALWMTTVTGESWSGWSSLGGTLTSQPDVSSSAPGRLDVFARGGDNALWQRTYAGGWGSWTSLGGVLATGPGAVSSASERIDVLAAGADGALWSRSWSGGWGGWHRIGGVLTSSPRAVSRAPGLLDVLASGADDGTYVISRTGLGWTGWAPVR